VRRPIRVDEPPPYVAYQQLAGQTGRSGNGWDKLRSELDEGRSERRNGGRRRQIGRTGSRSRGERCSGRDGRCGSTTQIGKIVVVIVVVVVCARRHERG
jgi:hypothetical protein